MNLRNWSKEHTIGLIIGLLTLIGAIFLVIGILAWKDGYAYDFMWGKFKMLNVEKSKVISLAAITNLFWFHRFLNKKNWNRAMGVILSVVVALFVILYYKFIA